MAGDNEVPARQAGAGRDFLTRVLNFFQGGRMEGAFVVPEEVLQCKSS